MKAKSIKGKSVTELRSALAETITADFKPTLAVVFSSVSQDLKGICDVVDAESIATFGCTTNASSIAVGKGRCPARNANCNVG